MDVDGGLKLGALCRNGEGTFHSCLEITKLIQMVDNGSLVVWEVKPMPKLRSENHEPICSVFCKVSVEVAPYVCIYIYIYIHICAGVCCLFRSSKVCPYEYG